MKVKCPYCGSIEVYNVYSGENVEEDISCGINVVEYECECEDCLELCYSLCYRRCRV